MKDELDKIPIKISVEHPEGGTASTWINPRTGDEIRREGEPTPQFAFAYNEAIRKFKSGKLADVGPVYLDPEQQKKIIEYFPKHKQADVIMVIGMRSRGMQYKTIVRKTGISRSTVIKWCDKLGMVRKRKKKK